MLITTHNLVDLILNSLGLTFILEVDTLLYQALIPKTDKRKVQSLECVDAAVEMKLSKTARHSIITGMVILGVVGAAIFRRIQVWWVEKEFLTVSYACLLLGANPDRRHTWDAVFPVAGFCESLV